MTAINSKKLEKWFGANAVPGKDMPETTELRYEAKRFAESIMRISPACADQSHAIRHVRDALQSAIQAVVLGDSDKKL